ncbi:hypothetical protein D1BOALGB6SA_6362 [Olavius sp. associated proteobacterium Delta 1]|nr:hypothetical protein D1BOALGB6SA_6362 [Olavius sp. associated proteobacterium Delta 1]
MRGTDWKSEVGMRKKTRSHGVRVVDMQQGRYWGKANGAERKNEAAIS